MKIAYIDCIGGASGDMLLGALVDAGVEARVLQSVVERLHLSGCELRFERVMKGSLAATQATVTTPRREAHRHVEDLLAILHAANLSREIKARAAGILQRLAEVEARIHDQPLEQVHLHELGGDDTLIDVVGVLLGLVELDVASVVVSPLPLGRGFVDSSHGLLPLPAPATLTLLEGIPIRYVEVEAELVTPTGAALLTGLADRFGGFPSMTLGRVGYGAGHRDLPFPNLIRIWLGETPSVGISSTQEEIIVESLALIETNIDDMNPQVHAYVMDRLFAAGALDVILIPIQMKKGRPAVLLSVLGYPEKTDEFLRVVFEETTTLGIRRQMVERLCLPRAFRTVETPYGSIRVKVARLPSGAERCMPEYEDCRRAAETHGVPLLEVMAAVNQASQSGTSSP